MSALSPQEIKVKKAESIPQWFLNAVNDLMIENFNGEGKSFTIKKEDVISRALAEAYKLDPLNTWNEHMLHEKGYLNFEPAYESRGWKVTYTCPDYTEAFKSYYTFKAS